MAQFAQKTNAIKNQTNSDKERNYPCAIIMEIDAPYPKTERQQYGERDKKDMNRFKGQFCLLFDREKRKWLK
jgi:hypothetical protein